ncbi:MAG: flagellar motor protein MotB, partial [Desulfomonilia bacterium]
MARKKRIYIQANADTGIFLYTSLMLILLTFFIVLCSMAVLDDRKERMAINSLLGSFGILPGGASPYENRGGEDLLPQAAPLEKRVLDIRRIRSTLSERGIVSGMAVSEG